MQQRVPRKGLPPSLGGLSRRARQWQSSSEDIGRKWSEKSRSAGGGCCKRLWKQLGFGVLGKQEPEPRGMRPQSPRVNSQTESPAVQSSKTGDPAWTVVSVGEAEVEQAREARRAGSRAHA